MGKWSGRSRDHHFKRCVRRKYSTPSYARSEPDCTQKWVSFLRELEKWFITLQRVTTPSWISKAPNPRAAWLAHLKSLRLFDGTWDLGTTVLNVMMARLFWDLHDSSRSSQSSAVS